MVILRKLYSTRTMPRKKISPWKVRPESAAITVAGRAKAAIGILADEFKSVSEQYVYKYHQTMARLYIAI